MKFNKVSLLVVVIFITSIVLAACGTPAAPSANKTPLKVSWNLWVGFYPLIIADKNGLFEKHGVQVELVLMNGPQDTMVALSSHAVDGSTGVFTDLIPLANENELHAVMVTDSSDGGDQFVSAADAATVADLKGKRIGTQFGTFSELFVREMLNQNGLALGDVQLVNVPPEQLPGALGNTVDAGHTYEPFTSEAINNGYHVLFSSSDTPGLIVDVVAFRGSVVKERPEDIRAFVAAWAEALAWWQANPAEGNAIIAEATGQKMEDISTTGAHLYSLEDNKKAFDKNQPGSLYDITQKNIDFFSSTGGLSSAPDITQLIDASFLP